MPQAGNMSAWPAKRFNARRAWLKRNTCRARSFTAAGWSSRSIPRRRRPRHMAPCGGVVCRGMQGSALVQGLPAGQIDCTFATPAPGQSPLGNFVLTRRTTGRAACRGCRRRCGSCRWTRQGVRAGGCAPVGAPSDETLFSAGELRAITLAPDSRRCGR
jgi:hypothetical protein